MKFPAVRHVKPGDTNALKVVSDKVGPVAIQMIASSQLQFYNTG